MREEGEWCLNYENIFGYEWKRMGKTYTRKGVWVVILLLRYFRNRKNAFNDTGR